jgi:AraC-like DNA-binding protein
VDFGAVVGTYLPMVVHTWDHPQAGKPFINHSGSIRLADLTLLSTWGSAIDGEVEQRCEAQVVVPYVAGTNRFEIGRSTYTFRHSSFFIPATRNRIRLHCTTCSGVIISFDPETLLPVAHAIAGPGFDAIALRVALEQPAILNRRLDPRRDRLHRMLIEALAFAESAITIGGAVNPMLRLDDLIRRLIVMMLVPDLLEFQESPAGEGDPFVHAGLVEWLLGNLGEPISLTDMEQRSSYSRRSLQYAFKQRFGCGPMQWLRRQRLSKARTLLEFPGSCRDVSDVAQACGYISAAAFSRDYAARYGERPSRVWRRFRDGNLLRRLQQTSPNAPAED